MSRTPAPLAAAPASPALALVLALGMAATVGTALVFQHAFGYIPCALCLEQRIPYYVGVPVALAAAVAAALPKAPPVLARLLLCVVALLMLWGFGLAVYHAGVEWAFWPGPADCSGVASDATLTDDLLGSLDAVRPPSCDQAAGRFLGLSFAGWNVLASALFAGLAGIGALGRRRRA